MYNHRDGRGLHRQSPNQAFTERILANDTMKQLKKRPSVEKVFTPSASIVEEFIIDENDGYDSISSSSSSSSASPETAAGNNNDTATNPATATGDYVPLAAREKPGVDSDDAGDFEYFAAKSNNNRRGDEASDDDYERRLLQQGVANNHHSNNNDDDDDYRVWQQQQQQQHNEDTLRNPSAQRLRALLTCLFRSICKLYRNQLINDAGRRKLKELVVEHNEDLLKKAELFALSDNLQGLENELQRVVGVNDREWVGGNSMMSLLDVDEQEEFMALYISNAKYLFASLGDGDVRADDVQSVLMYFDLNDEQTQALTAIVQNWRRAEKTVDFEAFLNICLDLDINLILPTQSEPCSPASPY